MSEEALAKGNKLLADNTAVVNDNLNETATDEAVDDYDEPFDMPPSTGLGFVSVGSLKTIAVSEEALAKGNKLFADNTAVVNDNLNETATDEAVDDYDEPFDMPPSTGLGFVSVGSLKTIAVSEEALAKGNKLLADNTAVVNDNLNETATDEAVDDYDEPFDMPPSTGLGFVSVGSLKTIAVSEEALAKGNKLLADNTAVVNDNLNETATDEAVDDYDEPFDMPPSTGLGFVSVGSLKTIAVSEEALAKGNKLLADNTAVVNDNLNETATDEAVDDYDEPFDMPPSTGLGFVSVGSLKTIAVSEEALARGNNLLDDNTEIMNCDETDHVGEVCDSNNLQSSAVLCEAGVSLGGSQKEISANKEAILECDDLFSNSSSSPNHDISLFSGVCEVDSHKETSTKRITSEDPQMIVFPATDDFETSKITSKVRFSLDGHSSCRFKDINESSSASISSRAGVVDSQSLLTPAKMGVSPNDLRVENLCQDQGSHPGSTNLVHIVTGLKDKDALPEVLGGEADSSSSPPYYSNAYTPLNLGNRRDSLQSEIKSKRLFQRTPSTKKTLDKSRLSDSASDALGTSDSTKVTMRELAERCGIETEWDNCKDAGVPEVVLKITSANASKLRFSQDEGLPLFFLGQRVSPSNVQVRKSEDVYDWLVDEGFDQSLFSKKWVHNHYRWIVWKLGSSKLLVPSMHILSLFILIIYFNYFPPIKWNADFIPS